MTKVDLEAKTVTFATLTERTCACGCGRKWKALDPNGWPFATSLCAAGKGVDVDFRSPHHEFNGAAMVATKIHKSITTQKKKGKKCKHHLKNL